VASRCPPPPLPRPRAAGKAERAAELERQLRACEDAAAASAGEVLQLRAEVAGLEGVRQRLVELERAHADDTAALADVRSKSAGQAEEVARLRGERSEWTRERASMQAAMHELSERAAHSRGSSSGGLGAGGLAGVDSDDLASSIALAAM